MEFAHLIPVNIIEIIVAVYLKLFEGLRLLKRLIGSLGLRRGTLRPGLRLSILRCVLLQKLE